MDSTTQEAPPPGLVVLIVTEPAAVLGATICGATDVSGVLGAKMTSGVGEPCCGDGGGDGDGVCGAGAGCEGFGGGAAGCGAGLSPEDATRNLHLMDPLASSDRYTLAGILHWPLWAPM